MLLFGECVNSMEIGDTTEIHINADKTCITLTDKAYEDRKQDNKEDSKWTVIINQHGISYEPWWVRVYYSSQVLQFIGEKVTPLLCNKYPNIDRPNVYFTDGKFNLIWAVGGEHATTILASDYTDEYAPAIFAPFDCTVECIYDISGGNMLGIESQDKKFTLRIVGIDYSDKLQVGSSLTEGTLLGTIPKEMELTFMYLNEGCSYRSLSPLLLFGNTGDILLDSYRANDYELVKELYQESIDIYLEETSTGVAKKGSTQCKEEETEE